MTFKEVSGIQSQILMSGHGRLYLLSHRSSPRQAFLSSLSTARCPVHKTAWQQILTHSNIYWMSETSTTITVSIRRGAKCTGEAKSMLFPWLTSHNSAAVHHTRGRVFAKCTQIKHIIGKWRTAVPHCSLHSRPAVMDFHVWAYSNPYSSLSSSCDLYFFFFLFFSFWDRASLDSSSCPGHIS